MKKKKLLIIIATHGNERIGLEAVSQLIASKYDAYFDILIGNPRALSRDVRFIDKDLNRSYPGRKDSAIYEESRAYQNLLAAKRYDYVLDIHEASAGTDDFIIVPREEISSSFPLKLINLKKILLWPDPVGPLSEVLPTSVELEFGMKNRDRRQVVNRCVRIIKKFVDRLYKSQYKGEQKKQIVYRVYGTLKGKKIIPRLNDFKLANIGTEQFYPLLVGQYLDLGIVCYKMRKIKD